MSWLTNLSFMTVCDLTARVLRSWYCRISISERRYVLN